MHWGDRSEFCHIVTRRRRTSGTGSPCPWPTNFPGTVSGDPNTSSAGDVPRSSVGIVLNPSMTL